LIFVDTDVFAIDRLFPKDTRQRRNRQFLEQTSDKATSIYNLLELCGIASFTLTPTELTSLFTDFHQQYGLQILYPRILRLSPEGLVQHQISKIFEKICLRMNYPDAQILLVAEEYNCSELVTWNTRHFEGRTHLPVKTPAQLKEEPDA